MKIGDQINSLTVISERFLREDSKGWMRGRYRVRCVCGSEKDMLEQQLKKAISCGCVRAEMKYRPVLEGGRYGKCVVIGGAPDIRVKRREGRMWVAAVRVECECGTKFIAAESKVARGFVSSCGCTPHLKDRSDHPLYGTWRGMVQRCHNPNSDQFLHYGGRGVSVCEAWRSDFEKFLADSDKIPGEGESIDRIDVNGDYELSNVRWADSFTQARNKRNSRIIEYNGRTQSLMEWAEEIGMKPDTLRSRIDVKGWDIGRAFSQQLQIHASTK